MKTIHRLPGDRTIEKFIILLVILVALMSAYFYLASRTDTFTGRWIAWKSSGVDDYLLFPIHTINYMPSAFYFEKEDQHRFFDQIVYQYKGKSYTTNLDSFLESSRRCAYSGEIAHPFRNQAAYFREKFWLE